jgi:hypothetical protein
LQELLTDLGKFRSDSRGDFLICELPRSLGASIELVQEITKLGQEFRDCEPVPHSRFTIPLERMEEDREIDVHPGRGSA